MSASIRVEEHLVEKYRLPDTPQANHENTLGRQTVAQALESDLGVLEHDVTAHQFGRGSAGPGGIGIRSSVHL